MRPRRLIFFIVGLLILSSPTRILDIFFDGRAAPEAYLALSYDSDFYPTRAAWLLGFLICNLLLYIPLIISGRWTPILRQLDMVLGVATCLLLVWVSAAGNLFATTTTDQFVKLVIGLIVLFTLLEKGSQLYGALQRSHSPSEP